MRKLVALGLVLLPSTRGRAAERICVPGEPHTCAIGNQPFDLPSSRCGFPISVGIVSDREYVIHDTFLADGTEIERISGELVPELHQHHHRKDGHRERQRADDVDLCSQRVGQLRGAGKELAQLRAGGVDEHA
jgi:hypothetical protein